MPGPNVKGGTSGSFFESKDKWKAFGDRNGRWQKRKEKTGQFGVDTSTSIPTPKYFISYDFELKVGDYEFGKGKIELNNSGFSASADINGPKKTFEVNRNFRELTKEAGFDETLIDSLRTTLYKSRLNFDIDTIKLKSIELEGPGAGVGATLKTDAIGAKASAQLGSLKFNLETTLGEISAKLKAGASLGSEVGVAQTKLGKTGIKRTQSLSFGSWEISLTPAQQAEQLPTVFDWSEFAKSSSNDRFSSLPTDVTAKLFQTDNLKSTFDFDSLSTQRSANISEEKISSPAIDWDTSKKPVNRSPQSVFSSLTETEDAAHFADIPSTANTEEARIILKNNLDSLNLGDNNIATAISNLNMDEIKKANQDLIALSQRQLQAIQTLQEQQAERNQNEALTRLSAGANGFTQFGQATDCEVFITIGKIIQFGIQIFQAIQAFQKTEQDAESLGNIWGPLASFASMGPIGMVLGALTVFMSLISTPAPDRTAIILDRLNDLLRGQEEIMGLIKNIGREQAHLLRAIKQDILALKHDIEKRLTTVRIETAEAFDRIEKSIDFLSLLTRMTARNQFLQNLKYHCMQKEISLKQGLEADIITRGLESILRIDAANEIITGYIEYQANLPKKEQVRLLGTILSTELSEEVRDQHLNFLLGYFYQQETLNPFIWQQAAFQYITHAQRFFALYIEDSDRALSHIISMGQSIEDNWMQLQSPVQQQKWIDKYYQALLNVRTQQRALIYQFNAARRQQYNQEYTNDALGSSVLDHLDFFSSPQNLIDSFHDLDDDTKKITHSFKHLLPNPIGKHNDSLQVPFDHYPAKNNDTLSERSFDLNLHLLAEKLKEIPREGSSRAALLDLLLCAEYLGLITLVVEANPMIYPDIPVIKDKNQYQAREIVRANRIVASPASPARYFLAGADVTWNLNIDINYAEQKCELIISATLPQADQLETLLKTASSGYVLAKEGDFDRLYYLNKNPKKFIQVLGFKEDFTKLLRKHTPPDATRRLLLGHELAQLAIYEHPTSMLKLNFSGDFTEFDTPIFGIDEHDGGYREPAVLDNSFHKKLRTAIPNYIEQNWYTRRFNLQINDNEEVKLKQKIEQQFLAERKRLLEFIINGNADDPQLQIVLQDYREALQNLDIASKQLKIHAHLAGKKLDSELLDSHSIFKEMLALHENLTLTDIAPTLSAACDLGIAERIQPNQFVDLATLSKFHPTRLLQGTITHLKLHKQWREWMRRSYPWLNYKDIQQYWTTRIYSHIEKLRHELNVYYQDIKSDVSGFTNAKARLNYAESAPITTATEFQNVYNALHDWSLIHSRNSILTGYLREVPKDSLALHLDYLKLKRGWADNIGFLIQYAAEMLDFAIDAEKLPNFVLWCDGATHLCKLVDSETGPYKNSRHLISHRLSTNEVQIKALENIEKAGNELNSAMIAVAFSEKLFVKLFERYVHVITAINIIVKQAKTNSDADFEIIQAMMPDDFSERRPFAGSYLEIKTNLNLAAILLKNYLTFAFNDRFIEIFEKTIIDGDALENELRKILANPEAKVKAKDSLLQKLIEQLTLKAEYIKESVLETVCYNRSISYFAQRLERYFDDPALKQVDTLMVTQDFLLKGGPLQNKIQFTAAHLDLLAQFLDKNPQIHAINIIGINFSKKELLENFVLLIKENYSYINKLTLGAANLSPGDLPLLTSLLPQLKHLDLRGNELGITDENIYNERYTGLIPFVEAAYFHLDYLGIANNEISAADLSAINAAFLMLPAHEKSHDFNLDITENGEVEVFEIQHVKLINDAKLTVEKLKPTTTNIKHKVFTLEPEFEVFGQPTLGQLFSILARTKKILAKEKLSVNPLATLGMYASSATKPKTNISFESHQNTNEFKHGITQHD